MPRGITQDQVNQAADAILGAGENPTVEKIRAALGTGSPNTVTRMLDAWRSQLGERLRELSSLPDLPPPVGHAMLALWQLATEHATQAIAGRFTEQRAALQAERSTLEAERHQWAARVEAAEAEQAQAQTAKDLADQACAALTAQLQDSTALRVELAQQRDRLQVQCDQLLTDLKTLRVQLTDQQQAAEAHRTRQEEHVRNVENRAHQEIDRLRQDAKQWQQRHEEALRSLRDAETAFQRDQQSLRDQLRSAEREIAVHVGQVAALEKALSRQAAAKPKKKSPSSRAPRTPRP
ncbi:MAG: DNA-binding protein [Burkholderiaceae bacterium]|nr:MAG: DNA-binding protein [Burkholderiaceae bacterium]